MEKGRRRPTLAVFTPELMVTALALHDYGRDQAEIARILNRLGVSYPTPKGTRWTDGRVGRLLYEATRWGGGAAG